MYENNNLSNKFKNTADNGYTQLSQLMDVGAWNKPFVFDTPYTSSIAPDKNNAIGIGERGMLHAFSYSGKHFYCIDSSKGWQESPYALKDDLTKSIDVKKYTSGALSKGAQKEINLTFEPRTGYTRRYFVGELTGAGSNSSLVNVHGSTLSFFAFDRDANITATILCIYVKD